MKHPSILGISFAIIMAFASAEANADEKNAPVAGEKKAPAHAPAPATSYKALTTAPGTIASKGMLGLYLKEGRLLVDVPVSIMGKDLLIGSTISSITDNRIASPGEKPRQPMQAFFQIENGKLALCKHRFDLESADANISRSIGLNTLRSIFMAFDIKAWADDKSSVLVDMTDFFCGNTADLSPFPPQNPGAKSQIREQFKRDMSFVNDVKSFADNVSIKSVLSYNVTVTSQDKKTVSLSDSPFTVEMTRSIILLPEDMMKPRVYDSRIGVFHFAKTSFSNENAWARNVFYALRWRIEKDKPLVFYVDPSFPESWKPYVKKGVEAWQSAFEEIGLPQAIVARDYPEDDPEFDPDNIKYNCIRYSPSTSTNAMGPMWMDPRSGEILNASVSVYHNVVRLIQQWRFVQTAAVDPRVRGEVLPMDVFGESLTYVVSHEIGHCLGLMHNMAGSSGIPVESLRDPDFTSKYGTTYSIMDYARFNYIAQPGDMERGVKLTPPSVGECDRFAIWWLYSPEAESGTDIRKVVDEHSGDLKYRYGKQQLQGIKDPSSIDEDLGDNPVAAARYGIANLVRISENIGDWCSWDTDFTFRKALGQELVTQLQRYISACLYNVGGKYLNEHYSSDNWVAESPVPEDVQRESVKFILSQAGSLAWLDTDQMRLCRMRSDDMAPVMGISLFKALLTKSKEVPCGIEGYNREKMMDDLWEYAMEPTLRGRKLTPLERDVQVQFVNHLISGSELMASKSPTSDSASAEICYSQMLRCRKVLSGHKGKKSDREHYALLVHKIDKNI